MLIPQNKLSLPKIYTMIIPVEKSAIPTFFLKMVAYLLI